MEKFQKEVLRIMWDTHGSRAILKRLADMTGHRERSIFVSSQESRTVVRDALLRDFGAMLDEALGIQGDENA